MSIMSKIFGNSNVTQTNIPAPKNPDPAPAPLPESIPTPVESPLKDFAGLWEPNTDAKPDEPLFGNVDPAKLMDAARKTNFSGAVTKEMMQKIQAGGQEAAEAFQQSMNSVAQAVFANSALTTTKIVEQALARQQANFEAKLPGIIKQHTVADSLRNENPIFSDPAVAPLVKAMEHQLAQKYPNATSSELTQQAKTYIAGLGSVFSPPQTKEDTNKNAKAAAETDWSKFFG